MDSGWLACCPKSRQGCHIHYLSHVMHTLSNVRQPIAVRLFLAVLSTTLIITLVGMGLLHLGMQKGFSRYVAQVEMQRLDNLVNHLTTLYAEYGSWPAVLDQAQKELQQKGLPLNDGFEQRWLRFQHEKMLRKQIEQRRLREQNSVVDMRPQNDRPPEPSSLRATLPPSTEKFPPLSFQRPAWPYDRLGLGKRLVLYDQNHHYVSGIKTTENLPMREILLNKKVIGYLAVKPALDPEDSLSLNFFTAQSRYLIVIYLVCLVVSAIVSMLLAAHFRDPIKSLLDAASELIKGNYNQHIPVKRRDELGDLATAMNTLSDILHQHEQSRRQWVADTSHELRTPISVLQAQIEALQDGIRQATPNHLEAMQRQVMTLKKLVQDLNELAQADVGQLKCYFLQVDPWSIVQQEVDGFQQKYLSKGITLEAIASTTPAPILNIDPDRIRQVVANLLENSWRYTSAPGRVIVSSGQDDQYWYLYVEDTLPGVSDEALAHLGERFYRLDHSRNRDTGGSGLGLALSRQIAEVHQGHLSFAHSELGGLKAILSLPLKQSPAIYTSNLDSLRR